MERRRRRRLERGDVVGSHEGTVPATGREPGNSMNRMAVFIALLLTLAISVAGCEPAADREFKSAMPRMASLAIVVERALNAPASQGSSYTEWKGGALGTVKRLRSGLESLPRPGNKRLRFYEAQLRLFEMSAVKVLESIAR